MNTELSFVFFLIKTITLYWEILALV